MKITEREFYSKVMDRLSDDQAVVDYCIKKLNQLDTKLNKARAMAAEKAAQTDELLLVIEAVLTDEFQTIPEIMAQIDGEGITPSKISNRLDKLIKSDVAEKASLIIPATLTDRTRYLMVYKLKEK